MNLPELQSYLLAKAGTTAETPFGPDVLVYKVRNKVYALVAWNAKPLTISLKCRPAHALALRAEYSAVRPGYHLNKEHWNTVTLDGSISLAMIEAMIDESYSLVVRGLSKRVQEQLGMG
jgi:predicted DNA-binding protein (MmcQ/YjbR family)